MGKFLTTGFNIILHSSVMRAICGTEPKYSTIQRHRLFSKIKPHPRVCLSLTFFIKILPGKTYERHFE